MNLAKLKKLHVIIIGSVLCVIVGVAMFFFLIKPEQENYRKANDRYVEASKVGNAESQRRAEESLAQARMDYSLAQQQLDVQMAKRMPVLDFSNRETGMLALWREQIVNLGPMLERYARDPKVDVVQASFTLPPPPANPNDPVFDQDVLVFPLGQVQVEGDFKSIMSNIRRWNNCNRLILLSPPVLQGQSPRLQAAYTVTCYVYPVANKGPQVPMAGAGTAQPGAAAPMTSMAPMAGPPPQ